jgi:myosin heavy subunit
LCELWGKKEGKIEKRILDENNVMEEFGNEKKKSNEK